MKSGKFKNWNTRYPKKVYVALNTACVFVTCLVLFTILPLLGSMFGLLRGRDDVATGDMVLALLLGFIWPCIAAVAPFLYREGFTSIAKERIYKWQAWLMVGSVVGLCLFEVAIVTAVLFWFPDVATENASQAGSFTFENLGGVINDASSPPTVVSESRDPMSHIYMATSIIGPAIGLVLGLGLMSKSE